MRCSNLWARTVVLILVCACGLAQTPRAWSQSSRVDSSAAQSSRPASLRWWLPAVQSRAGYDGYSVPYGQADLWITGGPLGLSKWGMQEDDLVQSELRSSGWVEVKRLPAPSPTSRRSTYHLDPTSGSIYLHSYDRGLVVGELKPDGAVIDVLHSRDEQLGPLFHSQGAGRLLGNHRDGFWVVNNFSGNAVLLQGKRIEHVPGLSRKDEATPNVQFLDAISGLQNTLWVVKSNQRLQRINTQGKVMADARLPFTTLDPNGRDGTRGLVRGGVSLLPSGSGVLVVSEERQQIASFNHDGKLLWQRQLCKDEVSYRCAVESVRAGRLERYGQAVGDAQGNALVGDGKRVFKLTDGRAEPVLVWGDANSCTSNTVAAAARGAETPFKPCFTHEFYAASLASNRLLLGSSADDLLHVFEMNLSVGKQGTELAFKPYTVPLEDMPTADRRQLWQAMRDVRHVSSGGRRPGYYSSDPYAVATGIVVGQQIFTTDELAQGALHFSKPHAHDKHPLVYLHSQPYSAASLSNSSILVLHQGPSEPSPKLWRFDIASKKFSPQPVQVKPAGRTGPGNGQNARIVHVFNDVSGKTLARDSGDTLGEVSADLSFRPIGQLPEPPTPDCCQCCGVTPTGWAVNGAAQDTSGRWWLLVNNNTLLVQQGSFFVRVALQSEVQPPHARSGQPLHLHQLVPGLANDMVVLTESGIATARLRD
jgi:hypothetical protein